MGLLLALSAGIIGGLGTFFSGRLADRLGRHRPWWRIGVVLGAILLAKPLVLLFLLSVDQLVALGAMVGSVSLAAVFWGPTFAYAHAQVPPHQRSMVTAIFLFLFNFVGLGIGPTLVGVLSDLLSARGIERPLAWALIAIHMTGFWGAWHYWRVIRFIRANGYGVPLSVAPTSAAPDHRDRES